MTEKWHESLNLITQQLEISASILITHIF